MCLGRGARGEYPPPPLPCHVNNLPNIGHQTNTTKRLNQKRIGILHLSLLLLLKTTTTSKQNKNKKHVYLLFCSLKKGLTPKICMLCFVIINSILFNLLRFLFFNFFKGRYNLNRYYSDLLWALEVRNLDYCGLKQRGP